eukprot:CAMPEP_0113712274 /NCGR_PEP_ID=MMETSP0038_2-20120614/31286_1 /TAXON_ID=2898 /ORGANISM="Cryptomonas paramecium" /LENGTH=49 /DNA_ID=CAMNT_0000638753 /DNA_START=258 /DNA_END=404 /DNA_ORIENTATION=- /assembly_acc=CAM_ASM_000170
MERLPREGLARKATSKAHTYFDNDPPLCFRRAGGGMSHWFDISKTYPKI